MFKERDKNVAIYKNLEIKTSLIETKLPVNYLKIRALKL